MIEKLFKNFIKTHIGKDHNLDIMVDDEFVTLIYANSCDIINFPIENNGLVADIRTSDDNKKIIISDADIIHDIFISWLPNIKQNIIHVFKNNLNIKKLPPHIGSIPEFDYDIFSLSKEWLKKSFRNISQNSEKIFNIEYHPEISKITFDIDRGNESLRSDTGFITINKRGAVCVVLCESLEGNGMDEELEKLISKKIFK